MSEDKLQKEVDEIFTKKENDFDYQPKFGGGGDIYLKFNDWSENEESAKVRLFSQTYTRLEFRKDDELVDSKGWDIDDIKKATEDPSFKVSQRFSWVVLVRTERKDPVAKVYECGTGVYKKIQAIAQDSDWSPITEVDLKIVRKGLKKDARYEVVPSPNNRGKISDNEFAIGDEIVLTKYLPQAMLLSKFREIFTD